MAQMNPLVGPVLSKKTLFAVKKYWVSHTTQFDAKQMELFALSFHFLKNFKGEPWETED